MLQKLVGQVQLHMHVVMLEAKVFNSVKQWFYLHLFILRWNSNSLIFTVTSYSIIRINHDFFFLVCTLVSLEKDWKRSVFIPIPKKGNPKECSNYRTIALISHASKVMLKILQARLQQYANRELPDVQAGFRKAEEPDIKLPTSNGSSKKQESSRKTSISALLTMPKPLTVWITINCGKFWKRWEYQATWPASWETCMHVRKHQLELDMEQQTGSK